MQTPNLAEWRRSSHSGAHGDCVEVAALEASIAMRDSKNPQAGHLTVSAEGFAALAIGVKRGEPIRW